MQTQLEAHALGLHGMRTRIGARGTMHAAVLGAAVALWLAVPIVGRAQPAGTTIAYHCSLHPLLRGKIIVVNFGEN